MTYRHRERQWVNDMNLQIHDTVIVTRIADSKEKGWTNSWIGTMDDLVNRSGTVLKTDSNFGSGIKVYFSGHRRAFFLPYFILSKCHMWESLDDNDRFQ